jgi:hypothetical protein
LLAYTRRTVLSAGLKLHLYLMHARKLLHEKLLLKIQARVDERVAKLGGLKFIVIQLDSRQIAILKTVEFEPGTAVVKKSSQVVMHELAVALQAVDETCIEFDECPRMHFCIEGHTAPSKKSLDRGKKTSKARARAVIDSIEEHTVNTLRDNMW